MRTGNFVYFRQHDAHDPPRARHGERCAAASVYPAIEIEKASDYWDGGLVSNTPLQWVVDQEPWRDTLAFQVDLWNSRGELPRNMLEMDDPGEGESVIPAAPGRSTDQSQACSEACGALLPTCSKCCPDELKNSPGGAVSSAPLSTAGPTISFILIYRARKPRRPFKGLRIFACCNWRNIGARVTTMPGGHCGIAQVLELADQSRGVLTFDLAADRRTSGGRKQWRCESKTTR